MKRRSLRASLAAILLVNGVPAAHAGSSSSASVVRPQAGAPASFGIYGSNTIGSRLMQAFVDGYAARIGAQVATRPGGVPEEVALALTSSSGEPLAAIQVKSHRTGTAFPALASREALIGMASRPITDTEIAALAGAGMPGMRAAAHEHVVGLDGLLVLVSPGNPLASLTLDQLAAIFSGAVTDWSAAGGRSGLINVYARDDESGTSDTFRSLVLGPKSLKLAPGAKRHESSEELSDTVARDPNGVGFAGFAYLRVAKALQVAGACGTMASSCPSPATTRTRDVTRIAASRSG